MSTKNQHFKEPLIDYDDKQQVIKLLRNNYISFDKNFKRLKEYSDQMVKSSKREYNSFHNDLSALKIKIDKIVTSIDSLVSELNGAQIIDDDLKTQKKKLIKVINDNFPNKQNDLKALLLELEESEKRFLNCDEDDRSNSRSHSQSRSSMNSLGNHQIIFTEYKDQKFMENQTKAYCEIKEIASKTLDLSTNLKNEVFHQGEIMNSIEENICESKENVVKGEEEIKIVEEVSKKQQNRIIILVVVILALIVLIIFLLKKYII